MTNASKVIYKWQVAPFSLVSVPQGRIVSVGMQHHQPTVWVEYDADVKLDDLKQMQLTAIATGQDYQLYDGWNLTGSAISDEYVWHVFAKNNLS